MTMRSQGKTHRAGGAAGAAGERGSAALLLLIAVVGLTVLYILRASDSLISSNKSIRAGTINNAAAATIVARLRQGLSGTSSCVSLNAQLVSFRQFAGAATPLTVNQNGNAGGLQIPCLLVGDEGKNVKQVTLSVAEVTFDATRLSRQVSLNLRMTVGGIQGMPDKKVNVTRGFLVSVATLDYFNVIFTGASSPLVTTSGPGTHFMGSTYYAGQSPISVDNIFTAGSDTLSSFQYPFFVRSNTLLKGTANLDWSVLRSVFTNGIETGSLNSSIIDQFLPNGTANWNQGFDFHYLTNGTGYVLPEVAGGKAAIDCDPTLQYQVASGSASKVPSPLGLTTAAQSCGSDTANIPTFLFMRPGSNLDITLTPGDNMFCGLVAASTLRIHLKGSGTYAVFGNFIVGGITVDGPADADLYVYNPKDSLAPEVTPPGGVATVTTQIRMLESSVAWNFGLPLASASPFQPRQPANYMVTCPNPAYYQFKQNYLPLASLPGFNTLVNDQAGALYTVGNSL